MPLLVASRASNTRILLICNKRSGLQNRLRRDSYVYGPPGLLGVSAARSASDRLAAGLCSLKKMYNK